MKKFKELRMTLVCFILFIVMISISILFMIQGSKIKMILALVLSVSVLMLLFTGYNIILFEDMMIVYEWKIIMLMPKGINYQDIKEISRKGKHTVIIEHTKRNKVYVFNSDHFIESYNKIYNDYINNEVH